MNTLKCLIVSQKELSQQRKDDILTGYAAMEKYAYGAIKVVYDFRVIPDFFKGAKLENNNSDLDEDWIAARVGDLRYHLIHIDMTDAEWRKLGLRSGLYGQSQVVTTQYGKQGITYGRWTDSIGARAHRELPFRIRKDLKSVGTGIWHESDHTLRNMFGLPSAHTHYYFYGYKKRLDTYAAIKAAGLKRYERTPDPQVGWAALPFHQLASTTQLSLSFIAYLKDVIAKLLGQHPQAPSKYATELQPLVKEKVGIMEEVFARSGMPIRVVEGVRSCEKQNELYAQGRTKFGKIVTNAKCGESFHQYGVAVDLIFVDDGYNASDAKWDMLGTIGEELGFSWGGRWQNFPDKPHFELTLGYSLKDFQENKVDYSKFKV